MANVSYPAAVAIPLDHARAVSPSTPPDQAATQAMAECPVFRQWIEEHRSMQEILQVVHQSLTYIMSGNKGMYVPPDEMQAVMKELHTHAEQFRQERKLNPSLPVARLKAKIGPGSHFAQQYQKHLEQHHPDHEATHEPHGHRQAKPLVQGHTADYHGHFPPNHELEHFFGDPV